MNESKPEMIKQDELMKAIGKAEVLTEQHEEAIEDLKEDTEDLEGWITVFLKAVKNVLLN